MEGSSRSSLAGARDTLHSQLGDLADAGAVGDELFAVTTVLDSSVALRRALADPSATQDARAGLADRLFAGKIGDNTLEVVRSLVRQRWSRERDLSDATAQLAVEAVLTGADGAGRMDQVENELFRVERTVAGSPELRDAFADSQRSGHDKAALVTTLLEGKVAPETLYLVRGAVERPRGQRIERVLESYIETAARLREQLRATAFVAHPLDDDQRARLAGALKEIYRRDVQINVVVDTQVVGGIRVHVGDEVIDGSLASRLDEARRLMTR
ncbi:F0F1 ATP synthase subunit delta [Dermatophilaceae bacterium Sec6.4]